MLNHLQTFICVTFSKKGVHCYPSAPEDVAYLKSIHRHLFKFTVSISVNHAEREIEFHQFLNWLESLYDTHILELNDKSCETIAYDLAKEISEKYKERILRIEVWEDGECGSKSEFQI